MTRPLRVGLVGCGNVSSTYLGLANHFPGIRFVACADLRYEAAETTARAHGLQALSVPSLLGSDDVDAVLNLTFPDAHAQVSLAAIAAGKHVYSEKPLATRLEDGRHVMRAADARGVRVGCAPDTVLGAGVQTARRLIDEGAIGEPISGCATMLSHGMEHFHPHPDFFYRAGGGPVLDVAPYSFGALVTLLGPVDWVVAAGRIGNASRTITAPASPRRGERIAVEVFTSVQGVLGFAGGAQVTFMTSWDVWRSDMPPIEIHGTAGSIGVPNPNWFGGDVKLSAGGAAWRVHATDGSPAGRTNHTLKAGGRVANYRGLGLAEMAQAIGQQRPHRADAEFALHLLAVMDAVLDSATRGHRVRITDGCQRPARLTDDEAAALIRAGVAP
jgi:predicted dehydrogenase